MNDFYSNFDYPSVYFKIFLVALQEQKSSGEMPTVLVYTYTGCVFPSL